MYIYTRACTYLYTYISQYMWTSQTSTHLKKSNTDVRDLQPLNVVTDICSIYGLLFA